ncbi:MAG TPA: hypothetical protein VOB72_10215 [Candidatus Dormibacteraeota bacterium]|nr:hypothetical protein [Candidatus Dormibacteraeota bacterium]
MLRRSGLSLGACAVALAVAIAGSVPAAAAGSPPAAGRGRVPQVMRPIGAAAAPSVTNGSGGFVPYEGGRVQHQPTVYLDYWGAAWSDGAADGAGYTGAQARTYIETFLRAIGGSTWFSTQTQFCDGVQRGTTACDNMGTHVGAVRLGATWNDTSTPVADEAHVAAEAEAAAAHPNAANVERLLPGP